MSKGPESTMCTKCVLDRSVEDIVFDENGVCNYCHEYDKVAAKTVKRPPEVIKREFNALLARIKQQGEKQKYDCVIGLSGGVDSTYLCLLAKRLELRPLIVHFDNGWNSELAVKNIENVVTRLGFDLYTYVINWEEFKDLQLAYLKASVVDIEVPTDSLISASLYKIARKKGIKTILSGTNVVTEAIVPKNWNYMDKTDMVNLTNIHKKFGTRKLKHFPKLGLYQRFIYYEFFRIQSVSILNLVRYIKAEVKKEIQSELEWKDYGGKHYESIFTRFYQGYILPRKFGIDKRKMHLATLICSGQVTRAQALEELTQPGYDQALYIEDRKFVLKKLGLTEADFENLMSQKPVPHAVYGSQWENRHFRYYYYFTLLAKPVAKVYRWFTGS
jgi:N-acetyl sugar amidotransferase